MKCNIAQARPRAPKEWERIPDRDKHIIIQHLKEKVMEELEQTLIPDLVRINLDHEEAELQKTWLKMGCIINHEMSGYGAIRNRRWLHRWKRLYRKVATFKNAAARDAYLDAETEKIFGKGGYPSEWVDSLENRGSDE